MALRKGKCRLRELLLSANMSQTELARKTGISRQMIVKYIAETSPMPYEQAGKIARALDCKMEDLFEWIEE